MKLSEKLCSIFDRHRSEIHDIPFTPKIHMQSFRSQSLTLANLTWLINEKFSCAQAITFWASSVWRVEGEEPRLYLWIRESVMRTHKFGGNKVAVIWRLYAKQSF